MFLTRGEICDMWKEELGIPHYLYILLDPRTDSICYIGITKQKFEKRLAQHRNPKNTNQASIAKLQKHLKTKNLKLYGEVLAKGSEEFISALEKYMISGYWRYLGKESLKNHQIGGRNAFGEAPESKQKRWETVNRKKKEGVYEKREGEKSSSNKLKETDILNIYSLIKKFYSNKEILKLLSLDIGITGLCQIRNGNNWKYLFNRENMLNIPSMNVVEGALKSQEKIEVLIMIENGLSTKEIQLKYKVQTTDLERIKRKELWKLAWNVYENYYKPLNN